MIKAGDLRWLIIILPLVGGGVTGFLSDRIGLGWEARWFRSLSGSSRGLSLGNEQVSFWRANMAVVIRITRTTQ